MSTIDSIVTNEDVNVLTNLGPTRYRVGGFRKSQAVLDAFEQLVLDPYCGEGRGRLSNGRHRYRRYDDFKVRHEKGAWRCERLPHRPFIQSPKFNKAVGGVARHLEPLTVDPSVEVDSLFDSFGFDREIAYHAKIHQIRVIATREIHGVAVVEGPHRDGHEWQIVAVFRRHNIIGGESQLLPSGGGQPFFAHMLAPGEALCNEDAAMWHNATDIFPKDPASIGYRDIWIIAANRWERRRYGDLFEAASLDHGKADWDADRPADSPALTPPR